MVLEIPKFKTYFLLHPTCKIRMQQCYNEVAIICNFHNGLISGHVSSFFHAAFSCPEQHTANGSKATEPQGLV